MRRRSRLRVQASFEFSEIWPGTSTGACPSHWSAQTILVPGLREGLPATDPRELSFPRRHQGLIPFFLVSERVHCHRLWLMGSCAWSSRTMARKHGQSWEFLDTPGHFRQFLTSFVSCAVVDHFQLIFRARHYRQLLSISLDRSWLLALSNAVGSVPRKFFHFMFAHCTVPWLGGDEGGLWTRQGEITRVHPVPETAWLEPELKFRCREETAREWGTELALVSSYCDRRCGATPLRHSFFQIMTPLYRTFDMSTKGS
nr:hypothetical protein CFP56_29987 [Quercus suber]